MIPSEKGGVTILDVNDIYIIHLPLRLNLTESKINSVFCVYAIPDSPFSAIPFSTTS